MDSGNSKDLTIDNIRKSLSFHNLINKKRKPDGSPYRSREEMKKAYMESKLPYPFSVLWNVEYCSTIVVSHLKNALVFSLPLSFVLAYTLNPHIRSKTVKKMPFSYYFTMYLMVYSGLITIFLFDAFFMCDYCKPWSDVYSLNNRTDNYKEMLKSRIKREQRSSDVQFKKTRSQGLKDEEI